MVFYVIVTIDETIDLTSFYVISNMQVGNTICLSHLHNFLYFVRSVQLKNQEFKPCMNLSCIFPKNEEVFDIHGCLWL